MNLYKLAQGKYHVRHIIFASNNHLDVFRANPQLHLAILLLASAHLPVLIPSFESTFRWRTALRLSPVVLFASSPSLIIPSSPYCLLSTTHFRYPHRVSHIGSLFLPPTALSSFFLTFLSWVLSWHTSTPDAGHCCLAISPDVLFYLILTPLTPASSTRLLVSYSRTPLFFSLSFGASSSPILRMPSSILSTTLPVLIPALPTYHRPPRSLPRIAFYPAMRLARIIRTHLTLIPFPETTLHTNSTPIKKQQNTATRVASRFRP